MYSGFIGINSVVFPGQLRYCTAGPDQRSAFVLKPCRPDGQLILLLDNLYMLPGAETPGLQPSSDEPYLRITRDIKFVAHHRRRPRRDRFMHFQGAHRPCCQFVFCFCHVGISFVTLQNNHRGRVYAILSGNTLGVGTERFIRVQTNLLWQKKLKFDHDKCRDV